MGDQTTRRFHSVHTTDHAPVRAGTAAIRPVIAGLLLLTATLAGCGDGKSDKMTRLSPRDTAFLSGIPVPAGFSLVDKLSEDHAQGGLRIGRHSYRGSADPIAVRDFYLEQMPVQGWKLDTRHFVEGKTTLRFSKRTETCTIEIGKSGLFRGTSIQVFVMPVGSAADEAGSHRPVP